ncbi:hypothetical protein QP444_03570, partial [Winkia sp. UMB1185]|uniref:hypothetical protein n=1 Tax=Winkia sp. UMB1185 TaxID=3046324 RepID=UPI00255258ED
KHAVSVRPEPGSNSPNKNIQKTPQKGQSQPKKQKKTKHNQNSCAKPTHKKEQKQKHTIENKNNHTTPGTWFLPVPPGVLAASANHQRNRNQL